VGEQRARACTVTHTHTHTHTHTVTHTHTHTHTTQPSRRVPQWSTRLSSMWALQSGARTAGMAKPMLNKTRKSMPRALLRTDLDLAALPTPSWLAVRFSAFRRPTQPPFTLCPRWCRGRASGTRAPSFRAFRARRPANAPGCVFHPVAPFPRPAQCPTRAQRALDASQMHVRPVTLVPAVRAGTRRARVAQVH
jgi:hypothetical protein